MTAMNVIYLSSWSLLTIHSEELLGMVSWCHSLRADVGASNKARAPPPAQPCATRLREQYKAQAASEGEGVHV
jgi:hypothetical protein